MIEYELEQCLMIRKTYFNQDFTKEQNQKQGSYFFHYMSIAVQQQYGMLLQCALKEDSVLILTITSLNSILHYTQNVQYSYPHTIASLQDLDV